MSLKNDAIAPPKVSILSISYNQEKYIRQALEGFMIQKTDFRFEVIIADDGSSDKTPQIIQEYAAKYPKIVKPILRPKNIGTVPNIVDILGRATGTYVSICEGDDFWTDPNKLQIQTDFMDKNPDCALSFHLVNLLYEDGSGTNEIFPGVKDLSWYTTEELLRTNYIPTNAVMYRRQKYDSLPMNLMPFDWYLHLYHAQFGKIKIINAAMSTYRKHPGGIWWEYDRNRDEIWKKYGIAFLTFLDETLKIYNTNTNYAAIITASTNTMLDTLLSVDEHHRTKLYETAIQMFPEKQKPFTIFQHHELEKKEARIKSLTKELLTAGDKSADELRKLAAQIATLKERYAETADELASIKGSRTWRARMKLAKLSREKKSL